MGLKAAPQRILLKVDTDFKNNYSLTKDVTIRLERNVENLNHRETMPVQGICIEDRPDVPYGAMVLVNHNSFHASNQVFNYSGLSGEEIASGIGIFSVPQSECYLWKTKEMGDWQPIRGFEIAERIFMPYKGKLKGIPPSKIKDTLYVKTGYYKGKVVKTLKACDYEMVFRGDDGKEQRLIRFRTFYPEQNEREEVLFVDEYLTGLVNKKKVLIGLSDVSCKFLNQF